MRAGAGKSDRRLPRRMKEQRRQERETATQATNKEIRNYKLKDTKILKEDKTIRE